MSDLLKLAERCEQAKGPDRELDAIILATLDGYTAIEERNGWIVAVGKGVMERSLGLIDPGEHSRNFTPQHHDTPAYTVSVDAAMTLVPDKRSVSLDIDIERRDEHDNDIDGPWSIAALYLEGSKRWVDDGCFARTPALALCAAALKARAASGTPTPKQGNTQ